MKISKIETNLDNGIRVVHCSDKQGKHKLFFEGENFATLFDIQSSSNVIEKDPSLLDQVFVETCGENPFSLLKKQEESQSK